jgi:DNA-binding transcriptional LysR family regulator
VRAWFDDAFIIALPPDHRLAGEEQIPVSALATERLLLMEEDGHCLRDQALGVLGLLAGDHRGDQDGFAATSLHTLVQMVASGARCCRNSPLHLGSRREPAWCCVPSGRCKCLADPGSRLAAERAAHIVAGAASG